MKIVQDAATFRAERAWGARDLVEVDGATVRLHHFEVRSQLLRDVGVGSPDTVANKIIATSLAQWGHDFSRNLRDMQ